VSDQREGWEIVIMFPQDWVGLLSASLMFMVELVLFTTLIFILLFWKYNLKLFILEDSATVGFSSLCIQHNNKLVIALPILSRSNPD